MKGLYICAFDQGGTLSYLSDWRDTFAAEGFDIVNITELGHAGSAVRLLSLPVYDVVVLGYSCFYGLRSLLLRLMIRKLARGTVVGFMQNEFRSFQDKVRYFDQMKIDVLVSQFADPVAQEFYCGRTRAKKIVSIPHGMFTGNIVAAKPHSVRTIDVGSRGYDYAFYLGNEGRAIAIPALLDAIREDGRFTIDWDTDPGKRLQRHEWMDFLANCRTTLAAEAGSFFLQWAETRRYQVNAFVEANPDATFAVAYDRFLKDDDAHLNGAIISARHFDAVQARTCQVLVEGRYNGVLQPSEHFITLKKDGSNIAAVIEQISDRPHCESIAARAYDHVASEHTLGHRVKTLLQAI